MIDFKRDLAIDKVTSSDGVWAKQCAKAGELIDSNYRMANYETKD